MISNDVFSVKIKRQNVVEIDLKKSFPTSCNDLNAKTKGFSLSLAIFKETGSFGPISSDNVEQLQQLIEGAILVISLLSWHLLQQEESAFRSIPCFCAFLFY
jgi:hypothetical protein